MTVRVVLLAPLETVATVSTIEGMADVEVVKHLPYLSPSVLRTFNGMTPAPDVIVVVDSLPVEGGLRLQDAILALRQRDLRMIVLSEKAPGHPFLRDLLAMGITDIATDGTVRVHDLERMLHEPTPWTKVAHLMEEAPSGTPMAPLRPPALPRREDADAAAPPGPGPREVVVERVIEKVVQVPAPRRGVIAVLGLGPPGIGVSTLAASVAAVLSQTGDRVVLVDADPDWPALPAALDLPAAEDGLQRVLDGVSLAEAAAMTEGFRVLAGRPYPSPPLTRDLPEAAMVVLADRLRAAADFVVLDLGHRLDVRSTRAALQLATEVLLVVAPDLFALTVAIQHWHRLQEITDRSKCRLVVNRLPEPGADGSEIHAALGDDPPPLAGAVPLVITDRNGWLSGKTLYQRAGADAPFARALRQVAGLAVQPARKGWWPFR